MPSFPPQPMSLARLTRLAAAALLSTGLAGCLAKGSPTTTGSISARAVGPDAQASLRATSETQGRRFDAEPGDAENAIAYAGTLRGLGQTAQAVAVLQQASIRNPRSLAVLAAYGKALADAGRFKEASEILSRAHTPERPDWRILSVQGAVAGQLGDIDGAGRYYEAALKINPGEPSILSNMGLTLALAKRLGDAETVLRRAAEHPGADTRVRQNLALVLGLQGKFVEAEAVLKRDLSPVEAAGTLASIRGMVKEPNSWKAMRQGDSGRPGPPANG